MTTTRKYCTLFALSISYAVVYIIVYLQYVLYDPMKEAFGINNTQMGFLMSCYAIGMTIGFLPGGIVADKFSTKKIIVISLFANGLVTLLLAIKMTYTMALIVWFLFSFTSAFAIWSALIKGVMSLSTKDDGARVYSIYYFGGGVVTTLLGISQVSMYSHISDPVEAVRWIIIVGGIASIICAAVVWFLFTDVKDRGENDEEEEKFEFRHVKALVKSPITWALTAAIFCVYGIRITGFTYFNPYLTDVKGLAITDAGWLGILRSQVFPMLSPIAGYIVDKWLHKSTTKLFSIAFAILIVLYAIVMFIPETMNLTMVLILSLLPALVSTLMYGVMFSVLNEARIPQMVMGTIIGIASIIGYSPDLFFYPLFGSIIDKMGGAGYNVIFIGMMILGVAGLVVCSYIRRYVKKYDAGLIKPAFENLDK